MIDPAAVRSRKPRTKANWLKLRRRVVTSTELGALFAVSPWKTPFALWAEKAGRVELEVRNNDAMALGQELEDAARRLWERETGGRAEPAGLTFKWIDDPGLGSSFDGFATMTDPATGVESAGLVECKVVGWRQWQDQWRLADGSIEPPAHYRLQAECELMLSGRTWLDFAVIVLSEEGRTFERVRVEPHDPLRTAIVQKVREFWRSVRNDDAPPPDFRKDLPTLRELFPSRDTPWEPVDDDELARVDDAARRAVEASAREKAAKADADAARAEMLHALRGCDVAQLPSARVSHRPDKRGRRTLRITAVENNIQQES